MGARRLKPKPCRAKGCDVVFEPWNSTQVVCGPKCAIEYTREKALEKRKKQNNAERREMKLEDRGYQTQLAQQEINRWVRMVRDKDEPCISCRLPLNDVTPRAIHAGHYRTVGAHPELRFEPLNIHKQCSVCNDHLSGNLIKYRQALIEKIGIEKVEWLEGKHESAKLSVAHIREVRAYYRGLNKEAGVL